MVCTSSAQLNAWTRHSDMDQKKKQRQRCASASSMAWKNKRGRYRHAGDPASRRRIYRRPRLPPRLSHVPMRCSQPGPPRPVALVLVLVMEDLPGPVHMRFPSRRLERAYLSLLCYRFLFRDRSCQECLDFRNGKRVPFVALFGMDERWRF